MSNLRDLNNAVQSAEFPSHDFARSVREICAEVTERLEPASMIGVECEAENQGYVCTKLAGHEGEHLACGCDGRVLRHWPNKPASEPAKVEPIPFQPFGYPEDLSDDEISAREIAEKRQLWAAEKKAGIYEPPISAHNPPRPEPAQPEPVAEVHKVTEQGRVEVSKAALFASPAVQEVYEIAGRIVDLTTAQPEPVAKPDCPYCAGVNGQHYGHCEKVPEPVAEEMPEAVKIAADFLRELGSESDPGRQCTENICRQRADALESFWRSHAAQPAKEEPTVAAEDELDRAFDRGYEKGVIDQIARQPAPAAVRMTEELEEVLRLAKCAEDRWRKDAAFIPPADEEEIAIADEIARCIAAVRAQAAEAGVKLPKVRELVKRARDAGYHLRPSFPEWSELLLRNADAAEAELDAHEKGEGRG
jgi:hypothetical protein